MADEKDKKEKPETKKEEPKAPPAPPRPVLIQVTSHGENGKYSFDVQVMSDQGRGIKARVRIFEGVKAMPVKETDEDGFLEHKAAAFTGPEQEFRFNVIGTDISDEVTLDGPEKLKARAKKKIKPITGGFWANVKHAMAEENKRKGK